MVFAQGDEFEAVMKESFNKGLTVKLVITGNSMEPFFKEHIDTAVITKYKNDGKVGDILLFKRPNGRLVLHRVLAVNNDGVIFKGDNQSFTEGPFSQEQILAKCICRVRNAKITDENSPRWKFFKAYGKSKLLKNAVSVLHRIIK